MRTTNLMVTGIVSLTLSIPAQGALVFTDRTTWNNAVGSFTTETFDNTIANADVIVLDNGIVSTQVPASQPAGLNDVDSSLPGIYVGRVGDAAHPQQIRWDLPSGINAWFADFSFLNSDGLTVFGDWDGTGVTKLDIAATIGGSGGFGIIGGATFSTFNWDTDDGSEFFAVDNFSQATASVPEPSALFLVGCGLLAMFGAGRRRA